jgi:phage terminase small subunit
MIDAYGLSPKQKALADNYMQSGNGTQAALQVYNTDNPDTAGVIASRELGKDKVRAYMHEKCEKANLTVDRVLCRLSEQLDADKTLVTPTGQVINDIPDWHVRHKSIETCIKYVIPEFVAMRQHEGGSPDAGSRHLHLHAVPQKVLKMVASRVTDADDDEL